MAQKINDENSLVVEPQKPDDMAKAIIHLIENPELYMKFIDDGIKTAKQFTWENAAKQMEKILLNSLEDNHDCY